MTLYTTAISNNGQYNRLLFPLKLYNNTDNIKPVNDNNNKIWHKQLSLKVGNVHLYSTALSVFKREWEIKKLTPAYPPHSFELIIKYETVLIPINKYSVLAS